MRTRTLQPPTLVAALLGFTLVLSTLVFTSSTDGGVFHLMDGTEVTGAVVEEGDGWIVILDASGKQHTLELNDILAADLTKGVDKKLERRAKKARQKLAKKRRKKIEQLLDQYADSQDEQQRRKIIEEINSYPAAMRLPGLEKAVRSKKAALREFALEQMSAMDTQNKVVPLVVGSLVVHKDEAFSNRAHELAVDQSEDLTRQVYEYVVMRPQVKPEHKIMAANRIAEIGNAASVGPLVIGATHVYQDIRLTMVNLKQMESLPVNLGSRQQAATQVDIDLPQTEMVQVQTSAIVPVEIQQAVQQSMTTALATITGKEFEDDVVAWANWYTTEIVIPHKKAKAKAEKEAKASAKR